MEAEASFSLKQWKLSQDYSVDVVFSTIGLIACLVGASHSSSVPGRRSALWPAIELPGM